MPRAEVEAHAEVADGYLFPQLATRPDLKFAASELRSGISTLKIWLISTVTSVAGLAFAVAQHEWAIILLQDPAAPYRLTSSGADI